MDSLLKKQICKHPDVFMRLAAVEKEETKNFRTNVTVLVGIPGSGKSTWAHEQLEKDPTLLVLSSDEIRKEMFGSSDEQGRNVELFEEIFKRAKEAVSNKTSIILDATNISRKRRTHFLSQFKNDVYKKAVYFSIDPFEATSRTFERTRSVSSEVINSMYKRLNIPVKGEGFDEVEIIHVLDKQNTCLVDFDIRDFIQPDMSHGELFKMLSLHDLDFQKMIDQAQDSTYHPFSMSRHTYHVYQFILDRYEGPHKLELATAALFHDIGKVQTKNFTRFDGTPSKYANYRGHENVSAQMVHEVLRGEAYEGINVNLVSTLCQFHMLLHDENYKHKKLIKLVGQEAYELLLILNQADSAGK